MPLNSRSENNTALVPQKQQPPPSPGPVYNPCDSADWSHFYWLPALFVWVMGWMKVVGPGAEWLFDDILGLGNGRPAAYIGFTLLIAYSALIFILTVFLADYLANRAVAKGITPDQIIARTTLTQGLQGLVLAIIIVVEVLRGLVKAFS